VTFQTSSDAPQFVATGNSQMDDVAKLLEKGGKVIQNADQIVESFISDQLPNWRSFLGNSYDYLDFDRWRLKLKQALVWALRDNQVNDLDEALRLVG
jgi:hypothetical protein